MKPLLTIITLVFTMMFSSTSFAEWTKVGESVTGNTFYVNFERVRKVDGYLYWWQLTDYSKLDKYGDLSAKTYKQGDCKLFRLLTLSFSYHKEPMGGGTGDVNTLKQDWVYPSPESMNDTILTQVCNR